jgi:hypothetical protein
MMTNTIHAKNFIATSNMVWLTGESNVKYMLGRAAFDQLMKLLGFRANFSSGQILENIVYLLYTLGIDA